MLQDYFFVPYLYCRITCPVGLNCDQMEEGEQYSEYPVERNPRAYMSMRDYINQPWKSQQPVERNPNEYRSMRDYRNQWLSSPYDSTHNHSWGNHTNSLWEPRPPQYAPPEPPYYASTQESPQSPQSIPPFEQAILDLTRIVDDFVAENKGINAHSDQKIVTVEDNLNKKLDGLKNDYKKKWDNLQDSIENLINQQQCPPEEECQSDTMVEEQCQQQGLSESSYTCATVCPWEKEEEITAFLTEEGSGKEEGEEPQKLILHLNPINLDPSATAQPQNSPLPVYILPTPAAKSKPAEPALKAHASPSLPVQNFKRLVVTVQTFATTSKTMATAHTAWHSGWFGCGFEFGAPGP